MNRLAGITREIAEFASPRPVEPEILDLNALIRGTSNLMRYDKRFMNAQLQLDLDPTLPAITAVADQLTQVFMNLLINAVDACEEAGRQAQIDIATTLEEQRIHVTVRDNGIGMDPQTLAHATEAFVTTKPAGKGTGLGLSLCNSIISAHKGYVELESVAGEWTCVNIYLPVEEFSV